LKTRAKQVLFCLIWCFYLHQLVLPLELTSPPFACARFSFLLLLLLLLPTSYAHDGVNRLVFSPCERYMLTCNFRNPREGESTVLFWDIREAKILRKFAMTFTQVTVVLARSLLKVFMERQEDTFVCFLSLHLHVSRCMFLFNDKKINTYPHITALVVPVARLRCCYTCVCVF